MRDYLISIWDFMDPLYYRCSHLTCLPCKEGNNIFRVKLTKYKGRNIVLSDGTHINRNDTLVKIHLHNVKLLKEFKNIHSEIRKAKMIYKYALLSLPEIERYIQNHPYSNKVKGIIGITSLSTLNKGCERLGFEIFEISHPLYKWFKQMAFWPINILSSKNSSILYVLKTYKPSYLFMSTEKLSNIYRS